MEAHKKLGGTQAFFAQTLLKNNWITSYHNRYVWHLFRSPWCILWISPISLGYTSYLFIGSSICVKLTNQNHVDAVQDFFAKMKVIQIVRFEDFIAKFMKSEKKGRNELSVHSRPYFQKRGGKKNKITISSSDEDETRPLNVGEYLTQVDQLLAEAKKSHEEFESN